ncbi:(d)CMP kinase [Kingella kingae]|uniref:(d)CMP kinase n=1 Tax=Kingella kingae TaxID=504 RepID=UPI0003003F9E|nr:(d)CMP kinase [Kingella kingae]MDK4555350.1 (d)CMP kinase [Kingella kingae]MDK4564280.1 (d)CMP kinase [Kingella kingae]MDK4576234.1 (d)CMP kinase [Kingella kingae]MDK4579332.1 (d)CMP kinase [Kingella kingae]MDK4582262.1 (d)CMP kinase [Kingella kingae]
MQKVIAIDGPSASGKGTVAARVATALGWAYLDSGALYRLTALYALQQNIAWTDENAVAQCAGCLPVVFDGQRILLAEQDVSQAIRTEQIGMGASTIAALPAVRAALLQRQRDFLTEQGLVADGRDMGSVVFAQAACKVFLTATPQIRAERRAKQIGIENSGLEFERILADIMARDENDRRRSVAPLQQLDDAHLLDTSNLTIEQAVQQVLDWYGAKKITKKTAQ